MMNKIKRNSKLSVMC